MKTRYLLAFVFILSGAPAFVRAADPDPKLAGEAYTILKKYCAKCHHDTFKVQDYDVLDYKLLTGGGSTYIVPGKLDKSDLWDRVGVKGDMPPEKVTVRPSNEEKEVLKKWIEAGAAPWPGSGSDIPPIPDPKGTPKAGGVPI